MSAKTPGRRCQLANEEAPAEQDALDSDFLSSLLALPALACRVNVAGQIRYGNGAWRSYRTGSGSGDAGSRWLEAVHRDDRARTAAAWREAMLSGESWLVEHRIARYDGDYRWHATSGGAVHSANNGGDWVLLLTD